MNPKDFEKQMRALEVYHGTKVPPGAFPIIRVDGRGFSKLTLDCGLTKPFDVTFHNWMLTVTQELVEQLGGVYGYTESDEISILLPKDTQFFDREVEKLVSTSAGIASSVFTFISGVMATFDARVIVASNEGLVTDYFRWRQADAVRCALNGMAYWTMRQVDELSASKATSAMKGKGVAWKNEYLFQRGINFNDLPGWQKRGTGVYWAEYQKEGFNPITKQSVTVNRRELCVDENLKEGDAYAQDILDSIPGR